MKNYVQLGDNISLPAPAAVVSGEGTMIGSIFGVASTTEAAGAECSFVRVGVFNLPKVAGTALALGQKAYWDAVAKNVTGTAAGNTLIGAVVTAANAAATSVAVLLTGQVV